MAKFFRRYQSGAFLDGGKLVEREGDRESARAKTIASRILSAHDADKGAGSDLRIKFDAMASHDITYVGIIQTARASGFDKFPIPYALTNCHNSLCAVGGTINEDDHVFGLSAAKKYGGIFVPPHLAVIHSYVRECLAGCGKMILGSDSHTRYGALGTMGVGEGGPELVKQLLGRTYDVAKPEVVAVWLEGDVRPGVGPQDLALALVGETFGDGFVKNRVLEFVGPGVANLSADFRCGVDVMTTETTCLSSIWVTDETIREYYAIHGREGDFKALAPEDGAYYDRALAIDLAKLEPVIALPFHPSNVYTIAELYADAADILRKTELDAEKSGMKLRLTDKLHDGGIWADQGVIAGCAGGTFENIMESAELLRSHPCGDGAFALNVYPGSQPIYTELAKNGAAASLLESGAVLKTAFCGPCFGAGDVPANNGLSVRHSTRNFPNREGAKPGQGQMASVALMDARSVAATAANGGKITSATEFISEKHAFTYHFDRSSYDRRVYSGFGKADTEAKLVFGPNIADWPEQPHLPEHLFLRLATVITDPVTTTDELIPSGETSSYRSNPLRLAEFTLSRKDPQYVGRAKAIAKESLTKEVCDEAAHLCGAIVTPENSLLESAIYATKPGDGSAREQAASCQRVLGGAANFARDYATKRYRSNLINWGMLPFTTEKSDFEVGDLVFIPNARKIIENGGSELTAYVGGRPFAISLGKLTDDERKIILDGCLINFYRG